jgi:hypothetical protein
MVRSHLENGALAGLAGGLVYGLFVATVGNAFTRGLETFEAGHGGEPAVSALTTATVSVGGGVLWGLLFGLVVFGVGFYLVEPALPGSALAKRLGLAGAGFLTVSAAPWLVLPPQPPGVEQSLATGTRLLWYAGMMLAGGLVSVLAALVYRRLSERTRLVRLAASAAPLLLLAIPVALAPANPVHGEVPAALVAAYRWTVVFGQALLWAVLAGVHAWLSDGEPAVESAAVAQRAD